MKRTFALLAVLAAGPATADDARQLDAHEHGVGGLDVAIEGNEVAMEFRAPGADIVGFEYAPATEADRAAISAAIATLGRPLDLFAVPAAAGCAVVRAEARLEGDEAHAADAEEGHRAHDHHAHADEGHGEEHVVAASHTEFRAEYLLACDAPSALTGMTFPYFDAFPAAREVEVRIVTGSGARAFEATRDAPAIDLSALF